MSLLTDISLSSKLRSDPLYPLCKEDSKTSLHFLGSCVARMANRWWSHPPRRKGKGNPPASFQSWLTTLKDCVCIDVDLWRACSGTRRARPASELRLAAQRRRPARRSKDAGCGRRRLRGAGAVGGWWPTDHGERDVRRLRRPSELRKNGSKRINKQYRTSSSSSQVSK